MVTDPIADTLTRIKNAYLAHHQVVEIPYSKIREKISKILAKKDYLKSAKVKSVDRQTKFKQIVCELSYKDGKPSLTDLERVSKPGKRVYSHWKQIPRTLSGYGITIISTSKGMMTDKEARKKKLGGEIICKVW